MPRRRGAWRRRRRRAPWLRPARASVGSRAAAGRDHLVRGRGRVEVGVRVRVRVRVRVGVRVGVRVRKAEATLIARQRRREEPAGCGELHGVRLSLQTLQRRGGQREERAPDSARGAHGVSRSAGRRAPGSNGGLSRGGRELAHGRAQCGAGGGCPVGGHRESDVQPLSEARLARVSSRLRLGLC